jgi:glycosyltransferase involved in cell wall biosynthesis/predicted  nucleic acid-binding Zn-ribbon protein
MDFESDKGSATQLREALAEPALDSLFWTPSRIGSMSAWWGHVPFAHWLISSLQPGIVVELGTHNGVSFAAFCEAMHRNRLSGRCYAVDTWQGDEQAGWYGEEVFQNLAAFIEPRYAAFAELLRMRFDEALPYFTDSSVDLLHIDGLHTYQAVTHDFESWLPKLSVRGVVLFHDINVRERDFGVWKLWDELRERYPTFEFLHAHGLGIAAVGSETPRVVLDLCESTREVASMVRERVSQLGARWIIGEHASDLKQHAQNLENERTSLGQSLGEYKAHAANLEDERTALSQSLAEHKAHVANLETERASFDQSLAEHKAHIANLEAKQDETTRNVDSVSKELTVVTNELQAVQRRLAVAERRRTTLADQLDSLTAQYEAAEAFGERLTQRIEVLANEHIAELNAVRHAATTQELALSGLINELTVTVNALHASTSWRVTRPLRGVKKLSRLMLGRNIVVPPPVARLSPEVAPAPIVAVASASADPEVQAIANSGLFDEGTYAGADAAKAMSITPIAHYLRQGEAAGFSPSALFDPGFYKARYPDVAHQVSNLLLHYIAAGRREGREAVPAAAALNMPHGRIRVDRSTIIIIVHEGTRTGAPILAWNIIGELKKRYNVVVLLRKGGPIAEALDNQSNGMVTLPDGFVLHEAQIDPLVKALIRQYSPVYVIANSVESRYFVPAFERAGVPVVSLVHEFSSSVRPLGALHGLFDIASKVVFSAKIVADAAVEDYDILRARDFEVLPQGASRLPPSSDAVVNDQRKVVMKDLASLPEQDGSLLVVGIGTITMRKGVEFFIAAAASVQRHNPGRQVRFLWIGDAYWFDEVYLDALREQVKRSSVGLSFGFAGEFEDLAAVYARADLVFLSSRLDPLPNVTIDAALHGIPVICFDRASGCAEILSTSSATRELVVPYLDVEAAAHLIIELASDQDRLDGFSQGMRRIATDHFDMERYVRKLDDCGRAAVAAYRRVSRDASVLAEDDDAFNTSLYLGLLAATVSRKEAIMRYLHASRLAAPRGRPETGRLVRRPLEGFHPLLYAEACTTFDEAAGEDPLVHYVRTGRPGGPWKHQIIRGSATKTTAEGILPNDLRVVIHGHFHYPELLEDFIIRLRCNRTKPDLVLTTTSPENAEVLQSILDQMDVTRATIDVTPNRGRDIAPMLTAFGTERFTKYDLVGHFHGKRSPHVDASIGATWRNFTWEHLLGGEKAMMDAVTMAMADDDSLGLVFPEDPHLNGWDRNVALADELAVRMGLDRPLPTHFDFPIGTMFWARPAALQPLQALGIDWDDFPPEPLPIDGSMLHALERLLPFSARKAGLRFATTVVDGCVR